MRRRKAWDAGHWMKRVVGLCLLFCATFAVATYVGLYFGVDALDVLKVVVGLFGGELVMTLIIKLIGDSGERKKDRRAGEKPEEGDNNG